MKSWWRRNIIDHAESFLIALVTIAMIVLFLVLMAANKAHTGGCLVVDVPPQAVTWVQDGDTFTLFTFGPGGAVKIRVSNVNTPELSKKKGQPDEPGAREAREFTRQWLAKGSFLVDTCGEHTFERIQAIVKRDGETLAEALVAAGFSRQP